MTPRTQENYSESRRTIEGTMDQTILKVRVKYVKNWAITLVIKEVLRD